MAPDQGPYGSSTAFASTKATCIFNHVRLLVSQVDIEYEEPEEIDEPFVSTAWKLEQRRYDRINAKRKYLRDVARAKRHFGFTKPVKKHSSRKHNR
jgi:hypothetical protein